MKRLAEEAVRSVMNTARSSIHELEEEVARQDGRMRKIMAGAAAAEWEEAVQTGVVLLLLDGVAIQAAVEAVPEEEDLERCLVKR
jgi:hypothetical protein